MKLFYMSGASSLAAHIVLEWTGQAYETVRMDRESIRSPEYLTMNPTGAVPLLTNEDLTLTQNIAILGYLADQNPRLKLIGDGSSQARAEVMRWLGFMNSDLENAFLPIFFPERYLSDRGMADQLSAIAKAHVRGYLRRLNEQLEGRRWLTGQRSIADAYLFVMLRWALSTKVGLHEHKNLSSFMKRMHADDGVHAALVMEEGLALRSDQANSAPEQLVKLIARTRGNMSTQLSAEIVGTVEYSEGDGVTLEVRRGLVSIDISRLDTVVSWQDEKYRGRAAIPFLNFSHYVTNGSIRLN